MASSEEALKAENARLVAEMASMKKKFMAAVKKQQADLQAKVQAAEQRALAAETAAAAATSALLSNAGESNGDNRCLPDTNGSNQEQTGDASPGRSLSSGLDSCTVEPSIGTDSPQFFVSEVSPHSSREKTVSVLRIEIERLKLDLEEEKRIRKEQENAALTEKQGLELEISNLKETIDGQVEQLNQVRESYESDLSRIRKDSAEQGDKIKKENEKLENQLLQAATQVSEAFARISSTQEEMECVVKEANEARHAHANLLKKHERTCEELEVLQTNLLQAKKDAENREKMDAVLEGISEQNDKATIESLLVERASLTEQLHERATAYSEVQKHAADLEARLSSIEEHNAAMLKVSDDKSLVTIVSELQLQNELLIAQLQESQRAGEREHSKKHGQHFEQEVSSETDSCEKLAELRGQSEESILSEFTSEDLVEQLRTSLAESRQRADSLTMELAEVQRKKDEEIKVHEEKYADLDMKFGKLQKRAKQRIQELQKEKDDVEAQLSATVERASQTSSHCNSLQHDLERVRAQAGDALRSLDAERQQLRNTNNRQREVIEDLHKTLETKEQELKELQHVALEKDQMVHELTDKLMEMEEKHGSAVADLVTKHHKLVEDLEAQLADAVQERIKATETISSLQMQLAEKESQVAALDAASSGEAVRLTVSLETARAELTRIEQEHRNEQEIWNAKVHMLKGKLEESEKSCLQQEMAAAEAKSQMETELERERQALSLAQADLAVSREQVACLEKEFAAYKVRAYSLLQKKEAELAAAKDAEQLATQEAALKQAQKMAVSNAAERDRALKALQDAVVEHESELAARSIALLDAEKKIRELATKVESTKGQMLVEQDAWQSRIDEINAAWQAKCDSLRSNIDDSSSERFNKEITSLRDSYENLKGEHEAFREMANNMVELKDHEIAQLLEEIREMQAVIAARSKDASTITVRADIEEEDPSISSIEIAEQQILLLARQQAQREEELGQCRRHIQALQDEIVELEHENRLHTQQETALKEELRILERSKKREGVDMTYLKNVILKLLETGEVEALLPVISMLLQFSPEELRKCHEVYNTVPEGAVAAVDSSGHRTLLSRFMFSKAGR